MLGDFIIWIKSFIKQLFCIHNYHVSLRAVGSQMFTIYECKKCGRIKAE